MKVENIRAAKARLNQIVSELPKQGSCLITRNGRACAVLIPVTDETDLEVLTLSANRRFWRLFDGAVREAESKGWIPLKNLPD